MGTSDHPPPGRLMGWTPPTSQKGNRSAAGRRDFTSIAEAASSCSTAAVDDGRKLVRGIDSFLLHCCVRACVRYFSLSCAPSVSRGSYYTSLLT